MVKVAGSANYKLAEVIRLLTLVETHLPLGKDEWERLAAEYNANRARGWAERDHDNLRRKFKMLYGKRKPTGKASMPPPIHPPPPTHIKQVKELKRAIDDKANVVEMDDEADEDEVEELEQNEEQDQEGRGAAGLL